MKSFLPLTAVWLCLLAGVHSYPTPVGSTAKDNSWDYLLFVERHPPGVCYGKENCVYPANATEWTIHGLWPSDETSQGPHFCNASAVFDGGILKSMWPTLVAEWTNCEPNTAFDSFWSHEYLKHGTCAEVLPALSTQLKFFQTVVSLFEQRFNFRPVLEQAGITPSTTTPYSFDDFNNAFVKYFGVKPFLECTYDKVNSKQILFQIYLCLNRDFSVRECSDYVFHERGGCWNTEAIYYV